jgi:hypothetical protein
LPAAAVLQAQLAQQTPLRFALRLQESSGLFDEGRERFAVAVVVGDEALEFFELIRERGGQASASQRVAERLDGNLFRGAGVAPDG